MQHTAQESSHHDLHSTVQYSAVQYSTVLHNRKPKLKEEAGLGGLTSERHVMQKVIPARYDSTE